MCLNQFLRLLRTKFALTVLALVFGLLTVLPATVLGADTDAIAQVLVVVVEGQGGQWAIVDKIEAPRVTITRAPGGCSDTTVVRKGIPLCKGDHVITGAGVKVKIAFGDPQEKDELTIAPNSDVMISSASCSFVCRWFGSWKNRYTNRTQHTSYTNEGTVYEVIAEPDSSVRLFVYDGVVQVKKEEPPVATPSPGESATTTAADVSSVRVGSLRKVLIDADGNPGEPQPVPKDELCQRLTFSSEAEIASHNNPAEAGGNFAKYVNYPTIAARNDKFESARCDSFWEPQQPLPFLTLAKVYNDWGDAEQALAYLGEATKRYTGSLQGWQPTDEFRINRAIALRQTGDYAQAMVELDFVIEKPNSDLAGDALNIRGSIFYDRARKVLLASQSDEATTEAEQLLQQAHQEYEKALQKRPAQPEYAWVNRSQVFKAEGDILKRRGQYPMAVLRYVAAIASFGAAYGRIDNPRNKIVGLLVARTRAALADAYAAMGDRTESFEMYKRAEETYKASIAEAERQNQKFAQAYCGLASLYLILGDDKARDNYDKCVAYNIAALVTEVDVPNVVGLQRPAAIQLLAEAGLEPEIVAEGETVESQQPASGKIKIGTKVKLTLAVPERE